MAIESLKIRSDRSATPLPVVQDPNGGHVPNMFRNMHLRQVFITPRKARKLLAKHNNYRNLDRKKAELYAEVMERGEWGIFPPICIGRAGELHDGQHRTLCGAPHKSRCGPSRKKSNLPMDCRI